MPTPRDKDGKRFFQGTAEKRTEVLKVPLKSNMPMLPFNSVFPSVVPSEHMNYLSWLSGKAWVL